MTTTPINRVIQHLLATCGRDGVTDGELLSRFLEHQDEAALAALVRRHGPMVWSVCRRLLRGHHDAEDAFQATFLVLVQKAATLPNRETVGNWLYGVAHQTAVRMRAMVAKQGVRERQVTVMPEPATADQYVWNDLAPVLDEELSRLPDKYRVLIVLCDLEGVTRKEVARRLDIPEGTAASRLAAARAMLAKRLTRRGVVLSGVLLGATLSQQAASASVPALVVSSTIKVASLMAAGHATAGVIPAKVAALTEGVLKAMFLSKLKAGVVVLGLGAIACVSGLLIVPSSAKAIPIMPFTDSSKFVEQSKDIVLAECLTEALEPGIDGIAPYEVKVVHVVKGDRKFGKLRVGTDGLEKGRTYMLAGFGGSVNKIDFVTNGELAVVELPPNFDISPLFKGSSTAQQVQTIFNARRAWVETRLRILTREKLLLDRTTIQPQNVWK